MNELELKLRFLTQMIGESDEDAKQQSIDRWNRLAKPLGSLGLLETAITRICALTGSPDPDLSKRTVLVLCADNGVVAQGVSQTDSRVTAKVADQLAAGRTAVCRMAEQANCSVLPVDLGILNYPGNPGVKSCRIANSTGDISRGIAMTRTETLSAILTGVRLVKEQKGEGVTLIATGEMGIGNTTTSSAVAALLLDQPVSAVTGRGAGLSEEGLQHKIRLIEEAIDLNEPNPRDVVDVLSKVGGLDLAGLCGVFLGGAVYQVPVLVDGFISAVAALCACRICSRAEKAIFVTHCSSEPGAALVLEALGQQPLITAGLHLGEGTGAVAAIPLLDMAAAVYKDAYTFEEGGISPYQPQ